LEERKSIATATIARIYMLQGLLDQSEAMYHALLQRHPDDPRLLQGLEQVRRRREARERAMGPDRLELSPRPDGVLCRWTVTGGGQRRAGLVQGQQGGRLALRLVTFPRDPDRAPQDIPVRNLEGDLLFRPPAGARLMAAAVGLLGDDDRFVAIAHCEAVPLLEGQPEPDPLLQPRPDPPPKTPPQRRSRRRRGRRRRKPGTNEQEEQ
jgi:hypothetical protein